MSTRIRNAEPMTDPTPPPFSEEAERAVLGSVLLDYPRVIDSCIEAGLTEDKFYVPAHRLIYSRMLALHERGASVDLITLPDALRAQDQLDQIGGPVALNALVDAVDSPYKDAEYTATVLAKANLRTLMGVCADLSVKAARAEDDTALLSEAEAVISEIGARETGPKLLVSAVWDDLEHRMENGGEDQQIGIDTGIDYWDHEGLLRFRPGGMYLWLGKQKCFKTTTAFHIANQQLFRGRKVGIASCEMPKNQALAKMGGAIMGCNVDNVIAGKEAVSDAKLARAREVLRSGNLVIEDGLRTVDEFIAWYRRGVRKHGWDLVILDYLQRLGCKGKDRWDSISATSEKITAAAKSVGVPILCIGMLTSKDGQTRMYGSQQGNYDCYAQISVWRDLVDDPNMPGQKRYEDDGFPDYNAVAWLKIEDQRFGPSGKTVPIKVKGRTGEITVPKDGAGIAAMMGVSDGDTAQD